jgi:hypothetical protein
MAVQRVGHEWQRQQQRDENRKDFRNKDQRLLLDLGQRLEQRHHDADDTISGEDTTTMVQIASRATSRVSAPVILLPVLYPRHCEEPLRRSNPAFYICAAMDCFATLAMTN